MKKLSCILLAVAVCSIFPLANTGRPQSISDVVKQEKKRKAEAKGQGRVYTNEDLDRSKQTGSVSTGTGPSEVKAVKEKEPTAGEVSGKEDDHRLTASAWLYGAAVYERALARHRQSRKPMLLYFYTDWCGYCRRFDRDILSSTEFSRYLKDVIAVRINPELGTSERALAGQYGVTGYPSFFVLPAGSDQALKVHPFVRQDGKWAAMTPAAFVQACKGVAGD
jgi:thiol-disulfide isomerase/thioredoxin